MQLQLDSQAMKALSSKSRVDILKLLGQRQYLQSELAPLLNLSVPTVKEHLNALEKAGLVERHDEGRKWKYYSLTKKGKAVLAPQETTILLVLGLFVLSVIGGVVTSLRTFFGSETNTFADSMMAESAVAKTASLSMTAPAIEPAQVIAWPVYLCFAIAVILAVVLAVLVYRYFSRRNLGKNLTKK